MGISMLFDPHSVIRVNGVDRTDSAAKLQFAAVPCIHLSIGLFMALAPKPLPTKFIISQMERRRRMLAHLPNPLRRWLGGQPEKHDHRTNF
jgi:hypothetical protein